MSTESGDRTPAAEGQAPPPGGGAEPNLSLLTLLPLMPEEARRRRIRSFRAEAELRSGVERKLRGD